MKLLKELLISVAIVAVLFLLVGVVLPSHRHLSETVETNRRQSLVFDTVNSFGRWKDWNAVTLHDPRAALSVAGPVSGVGATLNYVSSVDGVGTGSWKIVGSNPKEKVDFAVTNPDLGSNKRSSIVVKPDQSGRNTEITQTYDVDYGFNLLGRYAGLYAKAYVGQDMKLGLRRLAGLLSDMPNLAYDELTPPLTGMKATTLPAQDVLSINSGTVQNGFAYVFDSVKNNYGWIKQTMDANGLEPAGPFYVKTQDSNSANYSYDLVQPVRKKGSTAATGLTGVATKGTVKFETWPERKAVVGSIAGADYNKLGLSRDALRSWALVNGYQIADRSLELYKDGLDKSFTADSANFDIYWPVK